MTNKEKYKQTFSKLQVSNNFSVNLKDIATIHKKRTFNRLVASFVACIMLIGSSTVAYAADIGRIQRTIQIWIYGELTDATLEFDGNGNYEFNYIDENGEVHQGGFGGTGFDKDGNTRLLTEKELMLDLNSPIIEYKDDNSVWVYWLNQEIDITEKFENDVCYIKLVSGSENIFLSVEYQNGHIVSPRKYIILK